MVKDLKYQEVKEFKIAQNRFDECTKDRFRAAFGVDVCIRMNRPVVGSILDIIRPIDFDSIMDLSMSDDSDEMQSIRRPMLPFSGPYRYEVNILFIF